MCFFFSFKFMWFSLKLQILLVKKKIHRKICSFLEKSVQIDADKTTEEDLLKHIRYSGKPTITKNDSSLSQLVTLLSYKRRDVTCLNGAAMKHGALVLPF